MATRHNTYMATRHFEETRLNDKPPKDDKYILRFETAGHRARLKEQAARAKRSLNKQILLLIEAGEAALQKTEAQGVTS